MCTAQKITGVTRNTHHTARALSGHSAPLKPPRYALATPPCLCPAPPPPHALARFGDWPRWRRRDHRRQAQACCNDRKGLDLPEGFVHCLLPLGMGLGPWCTTWGHGLGTWHAPTWAEGSPAWARCHSPTAFARAVGPGHGHWAFSPEPQVMCLRAHAMGRAMDQTHCGDPTRCARTTEHGAKFDVHDCATGRGDCWCELDIVSAVFTVTAFTNARRHLPLSVVAIAPWACAQFQLTN